MNDEQDEDRIKLPDDGEPGGTWPPVKANVMAAQPAAIAGQASVIRAKVQVTRAATGKVEDYDLTFTPLPDEPPKENL